MKYTLLLLLLLVCTQSKAQPLQRAAQLYKDGKYEEAMVAYKRLLGTKDSAEACEMIGRIHVERMEVDSGMVYLHRALAADADRTWISGWAHLYIGTAWLLKGDKDRATEELNKTIALNKTQTSVKTARSTLASPDVVIERIRKMASARSIPDSLAKINWITIEGRYISFNFEDTAGWGGDAIAYMAAHDAAYKELSKIFKPKLPQKLQYYVWVDKKRAEALLGSPLGFTEPNKCICYVHTGQTRGHEMMHAISHWAWGKPMKYKNKFISEGVSVAFDLRDASRINEAKTALEGKKIKSVTEIWEHRREMPDDLLYPVGGAFVEYMYGKSTKEQFRELVKCQSIECARIIYGYNEFAVLVSEFDKIVGIGN